MNDNQQEFHENLISDFIFIIKKSVVLSFKNRYPFKF
jgi:hypothetical protein